MFEQVLLAWQARGGIAVCTAQALRDEVRRDDGNPNASNSPPAP